MSHAARVSETIVASREHKTGKACINGDSAIGKMLMGKAFNAQNPLIPINDGKSGIDQNSIVQAPATAKGRLRTDDNVTLLVALRRPV
jgi:hypothetical protein